MVVAYLVCALVAWTALLAINSLAIFVEDDDLPFQDALWLAEFALIGLVAVTGWTLHVAL